MKKSASRRLLSVLLAMAVLIGFAGQAAAVRAEDEEAAEDLRIVDEPVTVSIATLQTTYFGEVKDLDFTKWYEEQTGVQVDWRPIPQASANEGRSLMMAYPDDLPDAIMGLDFTAANQVKYGSEGIFVPLQDYIKDIGVYTKKAYDDSQLRQITAPDGNIYALAGINACYHCMHSGRAYINQEWLDNLGLEYPETTEEFYEVLKAFKEQDANGNGDPNDEVPMMGSTGGWNNNVYDMLMGSFVYNDFTRRLALEDDKITYVANTDAWKEGLLYVRKLFAEGLIDPVSVTQTGDQYQATAADVNNVRVGVVTGSTWWSALGDDKADPLQRSRQYVGLSPLEGPEGVRNALTQPSTLAIGKYVITKNAEDPELMFRWGDGLLSDSATMISSWGLEGTGWHKPDEGSLGINGKPALYRREFEGGDNVRTDWMPNVALANRTNDFRLGEQLVGEEEEYKWEIEPRLYQITKEYYEPFASDKEVPSLMHWPEEADRIAVLEQQITNYADEQLVNFLVGNRDIEADWDSYVAEFDKLGLDEYLELLNTAYARQYLDSDNSAE